MLRDAPPVLRNPTTGRAYAKGSREYWFLYQSGLLTQGGRAKPAAYAYAFPFVILNPGVPGMTGFWGQLRFRPNGSKDVAVIFWQPAANKKPCGPDGWTAAGSAGADDVPRLLQRHVPDAGAGRSVLRRVLRPDEGQDHEPLAVDDAVVAGRGGRGHASPSKSGRHACRGASRSAASKATPTSPL